VAELVDASVSKTDECELVPVRFRPRVPGLIQKVCKEVLQAFFRYHQPF
jgi:hypothetical protein